MRMVDRGLLSGHMSFISSHILILCIMITDCAIPCKSVHFTLGSVHGVCRDTCSLAEVLDAVSGCEFRRRTTKTISATIPIPNQEQTKIDWHFQRAKDSSSAYS
jgi:hypothetical protein